ncbi:MAG: DNA alkylation repair protein, partial [Lachnospiraceae bacterium]|nr:DNA alkylation repair protein [Lachnospiraceae bacterium]
MKVKEIREKLLAIQDKEYRDFQAKLIPTVDPKRIIGTRTPQLRDLAKELLKAYDCSLFLDDLPHKYFDEDQLHAFMLSEIKDYDRCMEGVNSFLPYVNNWATCDQMSPKIFKKHKDDL